MVKWFCILFNNQFTPDEMYDNYPADRLMNGITPSLEKTISHAICATRNKQIKETESTFRPAGTGVENYEKTIAGTEVKLSMLVQKLIRLL